MAQRVAVLVVHDIAQQGGGLDIATLPPQVFSGGDGVEGGGSFVRHRSRRDFKCKGIDGRAHIVRVGVIAPGVRAPADMKVDAKIAATVARDQLVVDFPPLGMVYLQADTDRVQPLLHPRHMGNEAHQAPP